MTREEKVTEFFDKTKLSAHWCTSKICYCIGCVNRHSKEIEWRNMFPQDSYLSEIDIHLYHERNRKNS